MSGEPGSSLKKKFPKIPRKKNYKKILKDFQKWAPPVKLLPLKI